MERRAFLTTATSAAGALMVAPYWVSRSWAARAPLADPWASWTSAALARHGDARVRAVAHAILSPNTQNLQPWLLELPSGDRIILRNGGQRRLAASDQPDRQLTVSFGTFAELLVLALEAEGFSVDVDAFPAGEPWPVLDDRPIAIFALRKAASRRDPLLDQILRRHTNRTPFDESRKVTPEQLASIRSAARRPGNVRTNLDPALAARIKDITLRAWDVTFIANAATREEVARYTHVGNAAIAAAPYGPAVSDVALAKAAGPVSYETLADPTSASFKANRAAYFKAIRTGWAHLWVVAPNGDRKGMFDAGRDWVRVHLQATALGLEMQPHSQSIQNFPEIEPFVREIHAALGVDSPGRIQMLGRIGHGVAIGPSPRLPVSAHIDA